jgi:soluble lytic murein transglycosylase-like protein
MLNNLFTIGFLILFLTFCSNLYAESYNITINVDGEEYYSDENGLSDTAPVSKPVSRKAKPRSTSYSVPRSRGRSALSTNKSRYADVVAEAADRHQVDAKLLHAVIQAESSYNTTAISSVGAVGLMQLMPATARRFGVTDRRDPVQNIDGGTRYLKYLMQLFDADLKLVVAAYNAGENAVIKNNNTIPPYLETRNYVKKVLSSKAYMKSSGNGSVSRTFSRSDTTEDWDNSNYTIEFNYD